MKTTNPHTREWAAAAEQVDARAIDSTRARPIAMLNITRTITDHIELMRDPDSMGLTIGQQIDNHLANAAREFTSIQTIALEFEREDWHEFASTLRGDPRRT